MEIKIKEMYERPIWREIQGVVKVGAEADVVQELEEYVVTRELQKHFAEFFSNYKRGILGNTDKMGVWLSGFFGSGKSHMLKILSYILSDAVINGKHATEYFAGKIADPMVLADMKLAADTPTKVILFNIDSKSNATGKNTRDGIVNVFLRAFNEMQGFCGTIPVIADMERRLTDEGKYQAFCEKFTEINGGEWAKERDEFDFIQDDVVETLVGMNFMSRESALNLCEKAIRPYEISIEDFAKLVKKYIDTHEKNQHVVFLVDEIGQYIGDDSQLMLNLQTVTEDLGIACQGKCWIIVTSQQDIDSITKTKGNDFSKIQGRFDTRLSLSSANVDEVIRQRILKKNAVGTQTLNALYDIKATIIKNLIVFDDGIEKKLYSNGENFSAVYPFVPYQFNILAQVLTSIRVHGASGKHLSEGERSMLAVFKDSAERVMEDDPGRIVPFSMFYDALERFLDHSHAGVITRAKDNEHLNPDHEDDCFNVNVLKALFMVKYVKEIKADVENITSLMVSRIDEDRAALRQRVEKALHLLIQETLVQKTGDIYIFLTDEEQEINRAINSVNVEDNEIIKSISDLVFDGLYTERKYRYNAFNGRYQFGINQFVDDRPARNGQSYDITLRIITPYHDSYGDDTLLRALSTQQNSALVVLPGDTTFMDELRNVMRIEKFLRYDAANTVAKYEQIKEAKQREMNDSAARAKLFLEDALQNAEIYISGDKIRSSTKEISARFNEALGRIVDNVYFKLNYITAAMNEADILRLLKQDSHTLTVGNTDNGVNKLALDDVRDYIGSNSMRHSRTSLKSIMDRFMKAPYGFVEADVEWLTAKLFKDGDIAFTVNNETVTAISKTPEELLKLLTRRENQEKLLTEKRERPEERQIKAVREAAKTLFGAAITSDDIDEIIRAFRRCAGDLRQETERYQMKYRDGSKYPGKTVIADIRNKLNDLLAITSPMEFFAKVFADRDELQEFAEDYEQVKTFFGGDQAGIFDKSVMYMNIYEQSKNYIPDEDVYKAYDEIRKIVRMEKPYNMIYQLPTLNEAFAKRYDAILDARLAPVRQTIADSRKRVFDELAGKRCHDKLSPKYVRAFDELDDRAQAQNNIAALQSITLEADALKTRYLNEIMTEEAKLTPKQPADDGDHPVTPVTPVIRTKAVSVKSLTNTATWHIRSEADVHAYMQALERAILAQLEENTVINIEF